MSHRIKRFAVFAIFASFYLFAVVDSISGLFGHQMDTKFSNSTTKNSLTDEPDLRPVPLAMTHPKLLREYGLSGMKRCVIRAAEKDGKAISGRFVGEVFVGDCGVLLQPVLS